MSGNSPQESMRVWAPLSPQVLCELRVLEIWTPTLREVPRVLSSQLESGQE